MSEVRVLAGVHTACFKPDLPFRIIHPIHVANKPFTLGDLILHASGNAVVEIKVFPAVALGSPDDLLSVVHVVPEPPAGGKPWAEQIVIEKCRGSFVDERADTSGSCVGFEDAIRLVAALIVFEREAAAILPPD